MKTHFFVTLLCWAALLFAGRAQTAVTLLDGTLKARDADGGASYEHVLANGAESA